MDKIDVVDGLASALDGTKIEGLGAVLATADADDDGTLVLEVFSEDKQSGEVFIVRISKYRPRRVK